MKISLTGFPSLNFQKISRSAQDGVNNNAAVYSSGFKEKTGSDSVEISSRTKECKTPRLSQKDINKMSNSEFKSYQAYLIDKLRAIPEYRKQVKDIPITKSSALVLDVILRNKSLYGNSQMPNWIGSICRDCNEDSESAKYKLQLIDKFLSDERLYNNLSLQEIIAEVISVVYDKVTTESRINMMDRFVSDEKMHNNPSMVKHIGSIVQRCNRKDAYEARILVFDEFMSNEKLYNNPVLKEEIASIMAYTRSLAGAEGKIKLMEKFVSDEELSKNSETSKNITDLICCSDCENHFKISNTVLSNPDLYNNPDIMSEIKIAFYDAEGSDDTVYDFMNEVLSNAELYNDKDIIMDVFRIINLYTGDCSYMYEFIRGVLSSVADKALLHCLLNTSANSLLHYIDSPQALKIANKAISAPELFLNNVFPIYNILINTSNTEERAGIALSLMDRIIEKPELVQSEETRGYINSMFATRDFYKCYQFIELDLDSYAISTISFNDRRHMANILTDFKQSGLFNEEELNRINKAKQMLSDSRQTITPTETTSKQIVQMMRGFFANNNPSLDKLLQNADFTQYGKNGIPLKYSREEFLRNLQHLLANVSNKEKNKIFSKLNINVITNEKGEITGYNGIINLTKLGSEGLEGEVLALANEFIKENSVITDNPELNSVLNSLIQGMPEFINVIGKKQHGTHRFSVDIHILKVLQEAMKNPEYQKLSNLDKTVLKFATVLHDIAKSEGVIDKTHPYLSSLYSRNILEKYPFSIAIKDRIFELIRNHHWLEKYDNERKPNEIAALFRHKDDYTIAKIMAEADLKGVSESFYQIHADVLSPVSVGPIENSLTNINSEGQLIFTSKIVQKEKIPTVTYNGKDYKVVDFTNIPDNQDLSEYGFVKGTKKEDLRLYVHMVDNASDLETAEILSDIANSGFLCASYISLDDCDTYSSMDFGISLECENINIANVSKRNQSSGGKKGYNDFIECITGKNNKLSEHRYLIPSKIKNALGLSKSEYAELYEQLARKQHVTQIKKSDTFEVSGRVLNGEDVLRAVVEAQDSVLCGMQNESNLYNPKINAFVAKVNRIEDIPERMLNFAYIHNLPIYLLGG